MASSEAERIVEVIDGHFVSGLVGLLGYIAISKAVVVFSAPSDIAAWFGFAWGSAWVAFLRPKIFKAFEKGKK